VVDEAIRALEADKADLRRRLDATEARAERADRQLETAREELDASHRRERELQTALADAVAAERIAAGETAALRAEREQRRQWSRWRRLREALRRN
jgi:hypothetical protein